MSQFLAVLKVTAAWLAALFLVSSPVAAQEDAPLPILDWQNKLTADERMTAFGHDLMGDSVDTVSYTHLTLPTKRIV